MLAGLTPRSFVSHNIVRRRSVKLPKPRVVVCIMPCIYPQLDMCKWLKHML